MTIDTAPRPIDDPLAPESIGGERPALAECIEREITHAEAKFAADDEILARAAAGGAFWRGDHQPLEEPLTPEELKAGDGYEPLITDVDCTPRIRRNESLREFRARTLPVIDGVVTPHPDADRDAAWNRYIARAVWEMVREQVDHPDYAWPVVHLVRGEIRIVWPAQVSDRYAAVLEHPRHAEVLAFQLSEAATELRRRRLGVR